jgi:hypothetical protein
VDEDEGWMGNRHSPEARRARHSREAGATSSFPRRRNKPVIAAKAAAIVIPAKLGPVVIPAKAGIHF